MFPPLLSSPVQTAIYPQQPQCLVVITFKCSIKTAKQFKGKSGRQEEKQEEDFGGDKLGRKSRLKKEENLIDLGLFLLTYGDETGRKSTLNRKKI